MRTLSFWLMLVGTFVVVQFLSRFCGSSYALVTFPGTFLHELAHYTAALLMDGSPSNFNLIPSGDTLGSVSFHPNWWNAASVALAPVLLIPLTFLFAAIAARTWNPLYVYLSACAWVACTPSPQDLHIAMVPSSWPMAVVFLGSTAYAIRLLVKSLTR